MSAPRLLAGRYEVGELIGRGGMAEVHQGLDTRLGRTVAIKILRSDHARDATFLARFRREAQSVASLDNPSIVKVYDSGDEQFLESGGAVIDVPYIVMEFVDGRTLRQVLNDQGPLEPIQAAEIVAQVLDALAYSHTRGIVHRDIKPGNVMLTDDDQVKVMDFGIARAVADTQATMTHASAVVGTAQYISPEQAQGQMVDPRSDVYSTGCLLFELLTGRTPFTGDPISLTYQHVSKQPPLASSINERVPEKLDAIITHALTKDREVRYATAEQMRQDLLAFIAGRRISDAATAQLQAVTAGSAPTSVLATNPAAGGSTPDGGLLPGAETHTPVNGYPPTTNRKGRTLWLAIVGALIIALGLATFAWWNSTHPDSGTVPAVIGQSQEAATEQLTKAGFKVDARPVTSERPVDEVIGQDPAAQAMVPLGSTVRIDVSSGPGQTAVPELQGLSVTQASEKLRAAGLLLGETSEANDNSLRRGRIIDSQPDTGVSLPRGSKVNVVLSTGKISLPNFIGKTQSEASDILFKLGVSPTRQKFVDQPSAEPAGTILGQSPDAGDVDNTATITLYIAASQPTPSATPSSSATPSLPSETQTPTTGTTP